jgi:hypothetical protein
MDGQSKEIAMRSRYAVLLIVPLLAACPGGSPAGSTVPVNLGGAVFPLGTGKDMVDESFTFFAGHTVDTFSITLNATGLSSTMRLEVRPGDGGTPLQTITSGGAVTATFPGNVGVLRFVSDGLDTPAGMSFTSMSMHSTGAPSIPAVTSSLTGQVTSMPLTLNKPVEIAFPVPQIPKTYFMTATGVAGKTLDIVVDGAARILIGGNDFVLPEGGGGGDPADFFTTTGRATTITMNPTRNTLFLTVTSAGIEGHTRVSVNETTTLLALGARFMSPTPITPAQTASVTAALTAASSILYQATMGRVRIGSLTLLSRSTSPAGSTPEHIAIVPATGGPVTSPTNIPAGKVIIRMAPGGVATNPSELAAALLNARFSVPHEPIDPDGTLTCPNSLMGARPGTTMVLPTLCRQANHNPFGSSGLGAVAPRSAWQSLTAAIGGAPPTASPVHLLRTVTTVTFPITTTIVP